MSKIFIGKDFEIDFPRGGCLSIDNKVREVKEWRHPRTFDPLRDSFNPFASLDYRKSCDIVDTFDALFPGGSSTLTREDGLEYIAELLEKKPANFQALSDMIPVPDSKSEPGHRWAYRKVRRILRSPVLRKVLCELPTFSLKRGSVNQARIDWAELGPFDALALGLFLIAEFKGPIVIREFHRYARPMHIALMDENRLFAGVRRLSQLKGDVLDAALLMETIPSKCTFKDAQTLAENEGLRPDHLREKNDYNDFIAWAMA